MIVNYSVKFRAFGITWGTTSGSVDLFKLYALRNLPWPLVLGNLPERVDLVDDRGVRIWLTRG